MTFAARRRAFFPRAMPRPEIRLASVYNPLVKEKHPTFRSCVGRWERPTSVRIAPDTHFDRRPGALVGVFVPFKAMRRRISDTSVTVHRRIRQDSASNGLDRPSFWRRKPPWELRSEVPSANREPLSPTQPAMHSRISVQNLRGHSEPIGS